MRRPLLRKNGYYYAVFVVRKKQVWRSLGTKDRIVAAERFEVLQREMPQDRRGKLSDFFADFLERGRLTYKKKTLAIYQWCFRDFLKICGDKQLRNVTRLDAERFRLEKGKKSEDHQR